MIKRNYIFTQTVWLTFVMVFLSGFALAKDQYFYSIHIASFKNIDNAARKASTLKFKDRAVFWKKTDIPGEGTFYRIYVGRYSNRAEAVADWKKIKARGLVEHMGIHYLYETADLANNRISDTPTGPGDKKAAFQTTSPTGRFVDNQDGTITDRQTNLMWIKNGWRLNFIAAETWEDAVDKCNRFRHGNYSDWRLPTIEEWHSLIDTGNQNPAMVEPNPFENIIGHMPYWSQSDFSLGPKSYVVIMYSGVIKQQNKKEKAFILPVRSIARVDDKYRMNDMSKAEAESTPD